MKSVATFFFPIIILGLLGLFPLALRSQTFTVTQTDFTVVGKPGDRIACHAEVKNLTNQKVRVSLSRKRNDIPGTWMSSFCLNQCYAPFTDNAQEDIPASTTLEFVMYFDTDASVEGNGEVEMHISSSLDPTESFTLIFKAVTSTATTVEAARPSQISLRQNYPNPFGPASLSKSASTTIEYTLNRTMPVTLTVYDMLGREVKTLVSSQQPQGVRRLTWDGTNNNGQLQTTGVYLYKLEAGQFSKTQRMILLR